MAFVPKEGMYFEKILKWRVKLSKLLEMPKKSRDLVSTIFIMEEYEWKLRLIHDTKDDKIEIGVYLYLHGLKSNPLKLDKIEATFRINMQKIGTNNSGNLNGMMFCLNNKEFTLGGEWGWTNILSIDKNTTDKNDILLVACEIWLKEGSGLLPRMTLRVLSEDRHSKLSSELGGLFQESFLTDLTIQVDGEFIQAHKNILAARSPVFRRMFEIRMVEAVDSKLIIGDFGKNIVQTMLDFIYTGELRSIGEGNGVELRNLLKIADKYEILQLKIYCESLLADSLTVENVIEMLILADMQNAPTLKKQALVYIVKNSAKVVKTKGYLEIKSFEILQEICSALALYNVKPDA